MGIFLKVMPKRGVVRFDKRGKRASRYIGPFEILEMVGIVAYQLALPPSLSGVHEVFHVSMLRNWRRQHGNERTRCAPPILSCLRMKVHGLVVY